MRLRTAECADEQRKVRGANKRISLALLGLLTGVLVLCANGTLHLGPHSRIFSPNSKHLAVSVASRDRSAEHRVNLSGSDSSRGSWHLPCLPPPRVEHRQEGTQLTTPAVVDMPAEQHSPREKRAFW